MLIDHSTVTATGNGANGIHTNSTLTIQNDSVVTIKDNDCSISSQWTIPGALYVGAGESVIKDSIVTIQNNSGSGIYQKAASASLTIEDSATVTVTNNTAVKLGLGGGIYVNGNASLADNVVLYNNHAGTAGDDIYVADGGKIFFGPIGDGWYLDGDVDKLDCNGASHAIDGWYQDGEGSRWNAHSVPTHVDEFTVGSAAVHDLLALKAPTV